VLPGIFLSAILFIVWDEIFTRAGVWGFNENYTTGIFFSSLPLEELLFFFCIPYACFFTYFALNYLLQDDWLKPHSKPITILFAVTAMILSVVYITRLYTTTTFFLLGMLLSYRVWAGMTKNISKFYLAYLILLVPFFIVNGTLTGSGIEKPVVWYNNNETMGLRIGTIPIEDFFYAMLMILLSITIAEKLEMALKKNSPVKGYSS
jgi:lycopene cyclase domain-containing protein